MLRDLLILLVCMVIAVVAVYLAAGLTLLGVELRNALRMREIWRRLRDARKRAGL